LSSDSYSGYSFEELLEILKDETVSLNGLPGAKTGAEVALIDAFLECADTLAVGVANFMKMTDEAKYVFFSLAPRLAIYGLAEKKSVNNRGVQRFQLSAAGSRFLAKAKPLLRAPKSKPNKAHD